MTDRPDFERDLEARLRTHADRAARPFDAAALARDAVSAGGRHRSSAGRHWWQGSTDGHASTFRIALVGLLLLVALTAGTLLVGAALRNPAPIPDQRGLVVAPTPTATATPTRPTAVPNPAPVEPLTSPDPALTAVGVGVGPCAPMVQLLATWGPDVDPPVSLGPATRRDDGYIVMASAEGSISAFDGLTGAPKPPPPGSGGRIEEIAGYNGVPIAREGRFVAAPDGQAIAIEQGDLGVAGCGDPLVRFAHGGLLHPFSARAFQSVTDLAWAHDGSALYGILRPTIDATGNPLVQAPEDSEGLPGTILRWDVQSREVTDLGTPCATCRLASIAVAPDGRVVAQTADHGTSIRETDGTWREIGDVPGVIGWTPDGLMVVDAYEHIDTVDLDGKVVTTSGRICCHGNGYGGHLSPDGTLVVGDTLSSDFHWREIVVIDVRDGSQRTVAKMKNPNGAALGCPCTPSSAPEVSRGSIVAWAPDGRSLLMLSQGDDIPTAATMWSLSLDTFTESEPIEVPWNKPPMVVWLATLP